MIDTKFDMCIKSVKNMQSNGQIFKIYKNVNDLIKKKKMLMILSKVVSLDYKQFCN